MIQESKSAPCTPTLKPKKTREHWENSDIVSSWELTPEKLPPFQSTPPQGTSTPTTNPTSPLSPALSPVPSSISTLNNPSKQDITPTTPNQISKHTHPIYAQTKQDKPQSILRTTMLTILLGLILITAIIALYFCLPLAQASGSSVLASSALRPILPKITPPITSLSNFIRKSPQL
ncbi:hypothetical protein OAT84_03755 [Gammaproteobacteria bacterium]|nr:hypothetical protein [Gammaproteobacteria bacterium]